MEKPMVDKQNDDERTERRNETISDRVVVDRMRGRTESKTLPLESGGDFGVAYL